MPDHQQRKKSAPRKPGRPAGRSKGQSRADLLAAAQSIVAEKGVGKLTIKDVSQRAEVNPALAHYYFGNKDGLEDAVIDHLIGQITPVIEGSIDQSDPPKEQLRIVIQKYVSAILADPTAAKFALEHLMLTPNEKTKRFVESYIKPASDLVRGIYADAVEKGDIKDARFMFSQIAIVGPALFYTIFVPTAGSLFGMKKDSDDLQQEFAIFLSNLLTDGLST